MFWKRLNPFSHVCSVSLLKILWEKEELLVTNNFPFSDSIFYQFGELSAIFIKSEIVVCGFKLLFSRVCSISLLKILWEKEELLVTNNFPSSHSIFYPFGELSAIFINSEIVVYGFFQFGSV